MARRGLHKNKGTTGKDAMDAATATGKVENLGETGMLAKADIGRGLVAGLAVAVIAIIADRLISAGAARLRRRIS